jgi:hypothetical protein
MMRKPIAARGDRGTLKIPRKLWIQLKETAAERGLSIVAAAVEAIELWISTAPSLEQIPPLPNPPAE